MLTDEEIRIVQDHRRHLMLTDTARQILYAKECLKDHIMLDDGISRERRMRLAEILTNIEILADKLFYIGSDFRQDYAIINEIERKIDS